MLKLISLFVGNVELTIELGRFYDGKRIKVIRKFNATDSNVRINGNEITVVSTIQEVELENDAIEAINLWNIMSINPDLKKGIDGLLQAHLPKY